MKRITAFISALIIATISANAGKNVIPAPVEPVAVPVPIGLYFGGGLTYAHSKCKCDNLSLSKGSISTRKGNSYGINLKAGYSFNEYIALEAKYLYTPWGDKDKTLKHYGLYFKAIYPLNRNVDIYALLGYGKTKCDTLQNSKNSFAWGAGAEYTFKKRVTDKKEGVGVYIEYLRPLKKSGSQNITVDTVSTGISYHF